MKLIFKIDKNYLITHTLSQTDTAKFSSNKNKKDIIAFQSYAWNKSEKYYRFLNKKNRFLPSDLEEKEMKRFVSDLYKYLNMLKRSKEFKKILSQVEKYKEFCEKEWKKNFNRTYGLVKKLTEFDLNRKFVVYVTHPSQRNGMYIGNNKILWGTTGNWKNYTTVYLWHEILHSYFDHSEKNHAIIELITDEEMRFTLNKTKYPPFVGHSFTNKTKKKLLFKWKKYLKIGGGDITKF